MSTATIEPGTIDVVETTPSLRPSDPGDHELFSHFVPKRQLEAAIFTGAPATALCGKKWLPSKDPGRFPVCPDCKAIYEGMDPGEPDDPTRDQHPDL